MSSKHNFIYETNEALPGTTYITVKGCNTCPFNQIIDEDLNQACVHPEVDASQPVGSYRVLDNEFEIELETPPDWCPMYSLTKTVVTLEIPV